MLSRVTGRRCFMMLTAFSRIALTLEPSPKMFGLLTTVGAWPGVDSWEHTCFDLAHGVSFDPTVLNVVEIRPYIVTQCL